MFAINGTGAEKGEEGLWHSVVCQWTSVVTESHCGCLDIYNHAS